MPSSDRRYLYHDPVVQLLLRRLIKGEIVEIVPELDPRLSVRYPEIESIVDGSQWEANDLLEALWNSGILKRRFYDKVLLCPSCSSTNVSSEYLCPRCNSLEIERQSFAEHVPCGGVDIYDNFSQDGRLYCKNCHREVVDSAMTLRQASGFLCVQCRGRSTSPKLVHRCKNCHHMFTAKDIQFVGVYSFGLGSDAEEEFKQIHLLVKPIGQALSELRFNVEMPGQITGRSGAVHRFDAIAKREGTETVVIDVVASADPITEVSVTNLYAKVFDLSEAHSVLIAIPSVSEKARMLGILYKIWIIESVTSDRAAEIIKAGLQLTWLGRTEEISKDLQV